MKRCPHGRWHECPICYDNSPGTEDLRVGVFFTITGVIALLLIGFMIFLGWLG